MNARLIALSSFVCLSLSLTACGGGIPEGYTTFVSSDGTFSVAYPEGWFYGQNEMDLEALFAEGKNPIVILPHPAEGDLIMVDFLTDSELSREEVLGFMDDFKETTAPDTYGELQETSTQRGNDIYYMESEPSSEGKSALVAYVTGEQGSYQLVYTGLTETMEANREDLKTVFESFEFKDL